MSYDSIARAAEHYWDSRQEAAEREAERQDAREEQRQARINEALQTIRTLMVEQEVSQFIDTIDAVICDKFDNEPLHMAVFSAVEQIEALA